MRSILACLFLALSAPAANAQQGSLPPPPTPHAAPSLNESLVTGRFNLEVGGKNEGQVQSFENPNAAETPPSGPSISQRDARRAASPPAGSLVAPPRVVVQAQDVKDDPRAPPNP